MWNESIVRKKGDSGESTDRQFILDQPGPCQILLRHARAASGI